MIAKRLRAARERKNLTQVDVKKRTGINNKTLSGYENSVSEPDLETLMILSELYEVSIDWITGNEKKEGSVYALPSSEIDRVIMETESHYGVNLRDDPVVLAAMKQMIEMLAQAKKDK
ncbi:helix-turn-helix domain-containing protein [Cohnella abietis]|uniref:HTH cro/C1-type domain-containing protein n=1 Tax=Cohnella abietis TaxID=2507935 RepID=A0A3T1D2X5_9BACL|nr:helix-turn-helix transcriptional regulator [Cohnella abietis]BBI32450.1 hypothetical protein KCTCHS21_18490 [Cohnella abietis]